MLTLRLYQGRVTPWLRLLDHGVEVTLTVPNFEPEVHGVLNGRVRFVSKKESSDAVLALIKNLEMMARRHSDEIRHIQEMLNNLQTATSSINWGP